MDKTIKNEREFLATLDDVQRAFFVKGEEQRAIQLQRSLLDLSRGISAVSVLLDDAQGAFLVKREKQRAIQLQRLLLDLSRGMSVVSVLHGEALAVGLAADS